MAIVVSALKEAAGENRVALTPDTAAKLIKSDFEVSIEKGAGEKAFYNDDLYAKAGVKLVTRTEALKADIVTVVNEPSEAVLSKLSQGQTIIGMLNPLGDKKGMQQLAKAGVSALAFELLPRTVSRAQNLDANSSQKSIAGYKAALLAADTYPQYFPMMMTAAGTARPAKVLVIGAAVAGLQAIGTAHRLGAVVSGYDIREDARGQIESLGAKALISKVQVKDENGYARALNDDEKQAQQAELEGFIAENNVIITTAQVPGGKPPVVVSKKAVDEAKADTVFIDLGSSKLGGNVAGSQPGETIVTKTGAIIVGAGDLASRVARSASDMYAKNVQNTINYIVKDGQIHFDLDDDVLTDLLATYGGQINSNFLRSRMGMEKRPVQPKQEQGAEEEK
ncbi:NAD(P) transhydrogenase subunit alpha [Oenococcus kitaharae]|uniref:proton-translocating NAD(P)(+) transhydrogenase n=1 Tax=Oenococcus kitaharae DSM 17330 TaxID=1045004 RepID=G9WIB8_9LACO|nr:NAD(P) transhydrogenase subunit alpha [Oenococcus kitaharae]EHN58930.1 NAD(P) transhydrogenase alpha subunit [Oenococcus kitaharae DSM 17330]MCV3296910.1 NAD(P) transhydrogenase subunit alpha [Oenococcus kitaharae]OEY81754.1 NAD(P) transhydrogenase subunit alpha [Oenococcus kitaharae]OEY83985.1 NAD(P) transhydrogenase subunit alpha [Oenococcus kitaharae]OEY85659.1 NAD(P) transhydrogenase subunit alpha [Oenococcus kitaharae]